MRDDAPTGSFLNFSPKALGLRPRGILCNRSYAVFLPLDTFGMPVRLPNLSVIAIARPVAAIRLAWERFTACHPAIIADAGHQGGNAALSCRLCLIACNSRQIDDLESGCD
jgi:hypothetical protein